MIMLEIISYTLKNTLIAQLVLPLSVSFVFFLIINYAFSPRIKISPQIKQFKANGDDNNFEFQIKNTSPIFGLNDIHIEYKITTPHENGNDILCFLAPNSIPYLGRKKWKKDEDKEYELCITIMIPQEEIKDYLVKKKDIYHIDENNITLNKFLEKDHTSFQIFVLGYSSFTGIKNVYKSKKLDKKDIKNGNIKWGTKLTLVKENNNTG
ncbi:MAG: hypothetical protein LBR65_04640 [Culturomica sp.]|nr:hypothetical protein [Culturomica sp.]